MKFLVILSILSVTYGLPQFVGLVGPSGSIGPSGIVGPSGPVQFKQPAYAFLGHAAHAHVAALNAVRNPTAVQYQAAPAAAVYGLDAAGCIVGPSGKVCPTGNVQFTT